MSNPHFFTVGYAAYIEEKGISEIITKYINNDRERIIIYLKTHLSLAAKHGKIKLVDEICGILRKEKPEIIELTDQEKSDIIHFQCVNSEALNTTALNFACLGNHENIGSSLLKIETEVHKGDEKESLSCLRRKLNKEKLLPELIKQASHGKETGDSCCKRHCKIRLCKPKCKLSLCKSPPIDPKKLKIGGRIFFETFILSILLYFIDVVFDIDLYKEYSKYASNITLAATAWHCQVSGSLDLGNETSPADSYLPENIDIFLASRWITLFILIVNGIIYLVGCFMIRPVWLSNMKEAVTGDVVNRIESHPQQTFFVVDFDQFMLE